jgi:hypothetical protein
LFGNRDSSQGIFRGYGSRSLLQPWFESQTHLFFFKSKLSVYAYNTHHLELLLSPFNTFRPV